MLTVTGLTKQYERHGQPRVLFKDLSFSMGPTERLAVLGRNGQGKSTLIKILGGVLAANSGEITWGMKASWPLGFGGAFQGGLTGIDNIRFLSRIYDRPFKPMIRQVEQFAELGDALTMPVKHYSMGMRARLAFGLSLAIEFQCYLIDEVVAVGDAPFQQKCEDELFGKRHDRAFIIASHNIHFIKHCCERAILIDKGRATLFDDINSAAAAYDEICHAEPVTVSW
jgi:capsular polysaccharide transport system ATP-binding protein